MKPTIESFVAKAVRVESGIPQGHYANTSRQPALVVVGVRVATSADDIELENIARELRKAMAVWIDVWMKERENQ